ncbi:hypothetical protein BDEG_27255 [Batrachochytrium dendrobatidis JEL423]|uniref:Protein BIG1 n=1 Tax=Batrachochytrium dendrobatidis (strain JEL423) TaxID=403673 RepID=A0A177WW78_BATDL|nr:hypothetical protein BDEG_27255 [Batrachochytrium dendrobatidis JEL423]
MHSPVALLVCTALVMASVSANDFVLDSSNSVLDSVMSAPLLMWSSDNMMQLPASTFVSSPQHFTKSILENFDCSHSASVVVHWPGLKGSDMVNFAKAMPFLGSEYDGAGQTTHIPHFVVPENAPFKAIQDAIKLKCADTVQMIPVGKAAISKPEGKKQAIFLMEMDNLKDSTPLDKYDAIQRDDEYLKTALSSIKKIFPDYLVFLTSSDIPQPESSLYKRNQPIASNSSIPYSQRPIFQRYVFFNPALFMGIFVSLILLAIVLCGVRILTSLSTPTRFETREKDK